MTRDPLLLFFLLFFTAAVLFTVVSSVRFRKNLRKGLRVRTLKGGMVQSRGEQAIADFLFKRGIEYVYDRPVRFSFWQTVKIRPDFYLPSFDVYIEYWGMKGEPDYDRKTEWKKGLYARYHKKLISLDSSMRERIPLILDEALKIKAG